ncbi:thioredoxin-like protein [Guyanagaster necrorhizus]|uniref:Thioredoxin-like protein n=1 Tax=Guyanagaster necrorhizus TaxID=856835 RepID=A0A9P8AYM8_9AGAR|nr:thioredoxin-like protein [Guyanagaster necrorhizus MCA 3950]KAG7451087.1 thioredoxin-like protein [Guyanagaster necrorhizus MCA 3950]
MSTNRVLKITVVNDLVCPNCYIGHHELLSAVSYCRAVLRLPLTFDIEFRPFQLIPRSILNENTPKISRAAFFTQHLGKDAFESFAEHSVLKWAEERKINITFDGVVSASTRAHRMSRKAYHLGGQNLQLPFLCGVFKAYLDQGQDIADVHVLAQIAETVNIMPKEQAIEFLLSDELEDEVNKLCEEAKTRGLNGVPAIIIDGRWQINGGQSSEVFVRIFKKLADCGSPSAAPSPFAPMLENDITHAAIVV